MTRWNPCKRNDFIKRLGGLGFEGAYSGAKHQFMVYGQNHLTVPLTPNTQCLNCE
jgi:predicted RNA binding protein YcfA (HicA-like mRNA interferase family)